MNLRFEVIDKLIRHLEKIKSEDVEGIFRLSGNALVIRKLYITFKGEPDLSISCYPHDISGALKLYLREIAEPLIPFSLYYVVIGMQEVEPKLQEAATKQLINKLPPLHRKTLKILIAYLVKVEKKSNVNKMTAENLAIIFGQNILRSPDEDFNLTHSSYQNEFTCKLIKEYNNFIANCE